MDKEELYKIGFKNEGNKYNGILNYHLCDKEGEEIYLMICVNNTDVYPTLVVNQYDWDNMESNTTYLTMINITNIELLQNSINILKIMFGL